MTLAAHSGVSTDELVFIHPSSVLHRQKPDFVVYTDLVQGKTKLYMKGITVVQPEWLARLVPSACTFGKPLEAPAPSYDATKDDIRCCMAGSFGQHVWPLPAIEMSYPDNDPDRYNDVDINWAHLSLSWLVGGVVSGGWVVGE